MRKMIARRLPDFVILFFEGKEGALIFVEESIDWGEK